ncbi:MAG: YIP1 family protein [Planctomycetota bacterium]|nr:YIP1 family protein [Planctomycetota bacterium]
MSIEFRCSGCSKLLRTPDEAAGKRAKCPACGTILDVPVATLPEPTPDAAGPEGGGPTMPSPFAAPSANPFADATAGARPVGGSDSSTVNPYASPITVIGSPPSTPFDTSPRSGLPWECDPKSFSSFWRTVKLILFHPSQAFLQMRRTGLGEPRIFAVCGGLIGGLLTACYSAVIQLTLVGAISGLGGAGGQDRAALSGMILMQVVLGFMQGVLGGTVGMVLGVFMGGVIIHLLLLLFQGANYSLETTLRVVAYVGGAAALLQVIPVAGALGTVIVSLIHEIIGLSVAHETTKGKAAAAVLLPLLVCCGLLALLVGLGVFLMVQGAGGRWNG